MKEHSLMLRRAVLIQLEAAFPAGLPLFTLLEGLKLSGIGCDEQTLRKVVEYLKQKNFVEIYASRISSASLRAKLTAEGSDYLESGEF